MILLATNWDSTFRLYFNRFFDRNSVYVHIVHGDLTTMKGKIKDNIANIVRSYANSTHLQKSDFQEIIHIVDLDGVYISDDDVIGDSVAVEPIYSTTEIRTCNPEGIKFRNELKRKNLDVISSIQTVWGGVTYHAFICLVI